MAAIETIVGRIAKRDPSRSEATLQADIRALLIDGDFSLDDNEVVALEEKVADGTARRIDISVGNTIIEVKKDLSTVSGAIRDGQIQLAGYMVAKTERTGARYVGILTDGQTWILYNLHPTTNAIVEASRLNVVSSADTPKLESWINGVLATLTNVLPTPDLIVQWLGYESPGFALEHQYLLQLFEQAQQLKEVRLKKRLWGRLLRTALGTNFNEDVALFCDHTLLALEASIIAHAVAGLDLSAAGHEPERLLSGRSFHEVLISNVVEPDFFDWVLHVDGGRKLIANLIRQVQRFDWTDVSHDVLKLLYESVISAQTRHSLGEYYTADWLAARLVGETVTDPLVEKVLDPGCGSGTFLFHAVRRYLDAADDAGISNSEAIAGVQNQIFGLDIHPLAVILARTTYLMAIGRSRISAEREEIVIPVYLGDSVQWTRDGSIADDIISIDADQNVKDLAAQSALQGMLFKTGQILAFPLSSVNDPSRFDQLVSALAEKALEHTDNDAAKPRCTAILNATGIVDIRDREILEATFNLLCELCANEENHIWGYFVRNQVRPLWLALPESRGTC